MSLAGPEIDHLGFLASARHGGAEVVESTSTSLAIDTGSRHVDVVHVCKTLSNGRGAHFCVVDVDLSRDEISQIRDRCGKGVVIVITRASSARYRSTDVYTLGELRYMHTASVMSPSMRLASTGTLTQLAEAHVDIASLPRMLASEPLCSWYGFVAGDVVEIVENGRIVEFRVVK
jgi:DNA-directed RNA polymerase subunit H (RpoH/RPB5)